MDITGNQVPQNLGPNDSPTFEDIILSGGVDQTNYVKYCEGPEQSTPETGKIVVYAKTDGNMYAKNDAGVETKMTFTGGSIAWLFDNTVGGIPGNGDVTFNNATPASVTEIKVNDIDANGNDTRSLLQALGGGDSLYFSNDANNNSKFYNISSSVDNGTYFTYTVAFIAQNNVANFLNDEKLNTRIFITNNPFDQSLNTTDSPTFAGFGS